MVIFKEPLSAILERAERNPTKKNIQLAVDATNAANRIIYTDPYYKPQAEDNKEMGNLLKHLKGIAKTLGVSTMDEITGDYYKTLFEEEYSRHAETTRDLADAKDKLRGLTQSLQTLSKEKSMSNVPHTNQANRIDVPVDLGGGFIVTIQGLPGRPTMASCERLCKVIMAYAVAPQASASVPPKAPTIKEEKVTINEMPKAPLVEETNSDTSTLEMDFVTTTFDDLSRLVSEQAVPGNTKKGK